MAQHAPRSAAPTGRPYERHRPEETVLYHTIDAHWGELCERATDAGHAEVAVPARDRARLEHLCRYVCRPPIAQDRLE